MFEKIKKWYQQGLWTDAMVMNAATKGVLTETEVKAILEG